MVINKKLIDRLKSIVDNNYAKLQIGIGLTSPRSLLDMVFDHNYGEGEQGSTALESKQLLRDNLRRQIEKQKRDVMDKFETILSDSKIENKLNLKETLDTESIRKITQQFKDASAGYIRDWKRVAVTEVSNAVGLGSVDKIIENSKNPQETYAFRIAKIDGKLCKECRKFYVDSDGSPKLYRLTTIVGNGSNYGKKRDAWKAVVGSTHPSDRCSPIIELKPGFKLLPGGSVTFIGHEEWPKYIAQKLQG
jgi:hypothetical protein